VQIAEWRGRLEALQARKTAEALTASIPPFVTTAEHPDSDLEAIGHAWSRALCDGPFHLSPAPSPDLPATSLVFVRTSI